MDDFIINATFVPVGVITRFAQGIVGFSDLDFRYIGDDGVMANFVATGSNLIVQNCNFKYIGSNLSGDTHFYGRSIRATIYDDSNFSDNTFEYTWTAVNCGADRTAWVVTINGNTVSNQRGGHGNTDAINFGNQITDYNGSVISNNDVSGFWDDGIDLFYASNVIVRNNIIHDIGAGSTGDGNGIKCGGVVGAVHSVGNQILRNLVYNINAGSSKCAINANGCENVLVAYNILRDCDYGYLDGALTANSDNDNPQLYNNIIENMTDRGININPGIDTDNRKTATVTNNICDAVNMDIRINDWVNCGGGHNCLVNDANVSESANANYTGTNDLGTTNPLFVDGAGHDFRLLMASPCINAGIDVGLTTDYRGRSVRHAPDIGAYEDPTNAIFMMTRFFNYIKEKRNGKQ